MIVINYEDSSRYSSRLDLFYIYGAIVN